MEIRFGLAPAKNSTLMSNRHQERFVFVIWGARADDGCKDLRVLHVRPVDHVSRGCVKDGSFTSSKILLDSSVWYLTQERFLGAFGKDREKRSERVFMNPVHQSFW
jgi:hypothetical protein